MEVFIRQAHPGPGVPPYRSFERKFEDGVRYVQQEELPWTVLVDDLEGSVHQSYGAMADPSYLIGSDGASPSTTCGRMRPRSTMRSWRCWRGVGRVWSGAGSTTQCTSPLNDGWVEGNSAGPAAELHRSPDRRAWHGRRDLARLPDTACPCAAHAAVRAAAAPRQARARCGRGTPRRPRRPPSTAVGALQSGHSFQGHRSACRLEGRLRRSQERLTGCGATTPCHCRHELRRLNARAASVTCASKPRSRSAAAITSGQPAARTPARTTTDSPCPRIGVRR